MGVRNKVVASWLVAMLALSGCSGIPVSVEADSEFTTLKSLLKAGVTKRVMTWATTEAGDSNPENISPLADALNKAWEPLFADLEPGKSHKWSTAGVALASEPDQIAVLCLPPVEFYLDQSHGVYCRIPEVKGGVAPVSGNIVLPHAVFQDELAVTPDAKKPAVMLMIAYFYASHLSRVMSEEGLAQAWLPSSRTQWCLAGVSLRALWPQARTTLPSQAPAPSPAPSAVAQPRPPLGLTYVFGGADSDDRHTSWVLEGLHGPDINSCFALS